MNPGFIDDLARRIADSLPPGARELQRDVQKNVRAMLHSTFSRLDLVTREEFEVQTRVLEHTRAKVIDLEKQVAELENRLSQPAP
ncbi:MAG: accessory factor UbiK family protein [Thiohalomonadaceae bacterium]